MKTFKRIKAAIINRKIRNYEAELFILENDDIYVYDSLLFGNKQTPFRAIQIECMIDEINRLKCLRNSLLGEV